MNIITASFILIVIIMAVGTQTAAHLGLAALVVLWLFALARNDD